MIDLDPERIAREAGVRIAHQGSRVAEFPEQAVIDSREVSEGDLFFGLPGEHADGGKFALGALNDGAWGVVVSPEHAAPLAGRVGGGWVFEAEDPTAALQRLATAWRRVIGCPLVGITGSTGKTSVKDITRAILPARVHASPQNFNTEIGMPLAILSAPRETEVLVMEMGMRGLGQIEQLCAIAEPDVAAITNVGPVHLELLGTVEAIAAAKAEILEGLGPSGRAVIPEDAEALTPHLHDQLTAFSFGAGGDVFAERVELHGRSMKALVGTPHGEAEFEFGFDEEYNLVNALCAIAIGVALDLDPALMAERTERISFSRLRGERIGLAGGIELLNDCYNANPISMHAALGHLAKVDARRRPVVLGGMAELGPQWAGFHEEVAREARGLGLGPIIGVGDLAKAYEPDHWVATPDDAADLAVELLTDGDVALIKGSRSVGLELVADVLIAKLGESGDPA